jgi:hypothetical protein
MITDETPVSDERRNPPPKTVKYWPGMPTRNSQMFESFVLLLPVTIFFLVALLMPLIAAVRRFFSN